MIRRVATPLLASTLLLGLAACGAQTSAADGSSPEVCSAMNSAKDSITSFADSSGEKTVGDVQTKLTSISGQLDTAKSKSTGLAQAIIGNLQSSVGAATQALQGVSPDSPISDLPSGFAGSRTKVKTTFDEVYTKLQCS